MALGFDPDTDTSLNTSLVAYYQLEDVTDHHASFDLTNINSVTFTSGKIGNAANFGTPNTTKKLEVIDDLGVTNSALSVSVWVWFDAQPATNGYETVMQHDVTGTTGVQSIIYYRDDAGTKKLVFWRNKVSAGLEGPSYTVTLNLDQWYHIVYTYDGTNIRGYVDGSLVAGPTTASGNASGAIAGGEFNTGATQDDALYLSGLVDEIGVWSKGLSAQEVTDLNNSDAGNQYREIAAAAAVTPSTLLLMGVG